MKSGLVARTHDAVPRVLAIREDSAVGFYLYVLEGGKCIYDDLQDDLETVMEVALEEFGVRTEDWKVEPYPPELNL